MNALLKKKAPKAGSKKSQAAQSQAGIKDYSLLVAPMITEKSAALSGDRNRLVFEVDRRASKPEIKRAVESVYNVKVDAVRTVNYMGKPKRTARSAGRRANFKKAFVTLKEGFTINIVEGV